MMNLLNLAKLLPAIKEGLRLSKILESRTTKEQWKGTAIIAVIVCIVLALLKTQITAVLTSAGIDFPEEMWIGVAAAALAAISPLMSRISAFASTPVLKLGDKVGTEAVRVMKRDMKSWRPYFSTFGDALTEGFDYAIDVEGKVYDLRKFCYTETVIRLGDSELERRDAELKRINEGH